MPHLCIRWVVMVLVLLLLGRGTAAALPPSLSVVGEEMTADFKAFVNNLEADAEDLLTAPLHVRALFTEDGLVSRPAFSYTLLGTGALLGGAFALDQTLRSHLRHMSPRDADRLQDISYGTVGAGTGLLYAYGLAQGDPRARDSALTATEGAGVAALMALGLKAAFGRLRPSQTSHSTAFFRGGDLLRFGRRDATVRAGRRHQRIFRQYVVCGRAGLCAGAARWLRPHGP